MVGAPYIKIFLPIFIYLSVFIEEGMTMSTYMSLYPPATVATVATLFQPYGVPRGVTAQGRSGNALKLGRFCPKCGIRYRYHTGWRAHLR